MAVRNPYRALCLGVLLVLCGCPSCAPSPDFSAELSDLVLCEGWDDDRAPLVLRSPIPAGIERICVCGYLETDSAPYLQVIWLDSDGFQTTGRPYVAGRFLSCLERKGGFEPDHYRVAVVAGKEDLGSLDFTVTGWRVERVSR